MKEESGNIFTIFDEILQKEDKELLLNQKAAVLWMTGLSGSGKTTIAKALERKLYADGFLCQLLDGDNIRAGICNNLGFSSEDRIENIRRISEVTSLFVNCGIVCINCFVSPTQEIRNSAREIIGKEHFHEIFVNTPIEVCETRDVKGLYKKARAGEIKDFTGISAPFEAPENPALNLKTEERTIEESAQELYEYIKPLISRT
ncbi:MAG: adenylyl-sulfate kinase [Flavobacteriales bacterium]|nr:adenylyl-sulfate kinase [Flavobacteriales bacterium]NNK80942.1 adenylyl-sulfate kinase [Flavobacteriales bacterium]